MKKRLVALSQNPRVLWGSFAAGFVLPPLFVLFVVLGAIAGWRSFADEYAEVGRYWHEKAADAMAEVELSAPVAPRGRGASLSFQAVQML